jgi:hypothetical protein
VVAQKGLKGLTGLITAVDPMLYNERERIAELANSRRIAVMAHVAEMTKDGLLMRGKCNSEIPRGLQSKARSTSW